jgi:hypothetical protein
MTQKQYGSVVPRRNPGETRKERNQIQESTEIRKELTQIMKDGIEAEKDG